jgi:3-phenylpropionate/trans-cinnamate dioxygenase ferredoxin component
MPSPGRSADVVDVRVCAVDDIAPSAKERFVVDGVKVCVVHLADDWYAIDDTCSHEDYSLCEGLLWEDEREVECWKHGSTFSLLTGEPQSLPATRPVPVYPVRVDGDDVIVSLP